MTDKDTYISDQFEVWRKCKKRYHYKYVKKLDWPDLQSDFELGKTVHALAQYYLRGFKIDHLTDNLDPNIKKHWKSVLSNPILKNKLVITEWGFDSRINNTQYWLNGRIDAIFYNEASKKYIIVDWKTGQNIPKDPENSFQAMTYLYSFYNARKDMKIKVNPEDIIFQFIKTSETTQSIDEMCSKNDVLINFSEDKKRNYEKLFLDTINAIKTATDYPKPEKCPIKHCQYKSIC